MPRPHKVEPFKSRYVVERSAYRINQDENIVHLRLLSPDNGKTHVEYFSYIISRGIQVWATPVENEVLQEMERKMHEKLDNKLGLMEHKTMHLKKQIELLNSIGI